MPIIPAMQEAEMGKLRFQASLHKKVIRPNLKKNKLGILTHDCNPSGMGGKGTEDGGSGHEVWKPI
jgi:hypothetical protein